MDEIKRLQKLAGINEIKVNNPTQQFQYCWIDGHSDYHRINLASEKSYKDYIIYMAEDNEVTPEEVMAYEWASYVKEIPDVKIVMLAWDDEGVEVYKYDDFHEFLKEISTGYYFEDGIIEILDEEGLNGEEIFNDFYDNDNKDHDKKIWNIIKMYTNNSEADGDSSSANLIIMNNKIIAGNKDNYYIL